MQTRFLPDRAEHRTRARTASALLAGLFALAAVDGIVLETGTASRPDVGAAAPPVRAAVDGRTPPFLEPPPPPSPVPSSLTPVPEGASGIPETVLRAYERAAAVQAVTDSNCGLTWPVLAGIGRVESHHARNGDVTSDGTMRTPIYGPPLNGTSGNAAIRNGGRWDRAAGPMQFIASTWADWGVDGSADGRADVQNVFDATLSAGRYLCANGTNMSTMDDLRAALLRYNHSNAYVDIVIRWIRRYESGAHPVRDGAAVDLVAESAGVERSPGPAAEPAASAPAPEPAPPQSPTAPPPPPPGPASECGPALDKAPALCPVATVIGDVTDGVRDLAPTLPTTPAQEVPRPR
ncbi:lytic transglycosylase [Saccharopolyspora aridisoli]|uniref:Lytic transglycosylase n=1 Tax=Saccharopolyspora aridisoli TaxID=2530385 RepID=A0A4R4UFQ1_9PSEU|nr:lytic transglycosylase domain-containing protein [Saccharopolyspora aridisoli]TDC87744.1 lytic transglycosylase [Saccharopolyspora aridisoli]